MRGRIQNQIKFMKSVLDLTGFVFQTRVKSSTLQLSEMF